MTRCFTKRLLGHPLITIWFMMLQRCHNPANKAYPQYGGRGIQVCPRWYSFAAFLEDMGERPPGTSLNRIDNNGHYEPGNVAWATRLVQANNQRKNRVLELDGQRHTVAEWARLLGINCHVIHQRLRRGYDPRKALTTSEFPSGRPLDRKLKCICGSCPVCRAREQARQKKKVAA